MKVFATATIAIAALVGVAAYQHFDAPQKPIDVSILFQQLDPECLGCGPDQLSEEHRPHPMAFALIATAAAKAGKVDMATTAADWLVANSKVTHGATGWGLGMEWDAFGDKSTNPADTIYGITTALAVAGLADVYALTTRAEYLQTAMAALDNYKAHYSETETGGCFWYSNQSTDSACVYNVTSMLLGQYARIGKLAGRDDFLTIAQSAREHLLANQKDVSGLPYWPYGSTRERPNDSVHAAYTVQGLVEYAKATQTEKPSTTHADYLRSFATGAGVLEFSPLHSSVPEKLAERPARAWGVGQIIYTLSDMGEIEGTKTFQSALGNYELSNPRVIAHVLVGLAVMQERPSRD